jgi:hypothetical protein
MTSPVFSKMRSSSRPRRSLGVALVAASLSLGCTTPMETTSEADLPFDFSLTRSGALEVTAQVGDDPAAGVDVIVRRPADSERPQPGILARGNTDATGHVRLPVTLRAADEEVEIVMNKAGLRGPYGNPSLRDTFGAFAPSAWFRAPASSIEGLVVPFEEVQ